jgi:iron(III) transport system substrate-binding protein
MPELAAMRPRTRPLTTALTLASMLALAATAGCGVLGSSAEEPGDIQVYSARHYQLEEAFSEFEKETGLKVDFLFGDDAELRERLAAEGDGSPADVYMTVDAGNLWAADQAGLLKPLKSSTLDDAVPAEYRAPDETWFGLALRARTVLYNPDNVDPSEFDAKDTYAGLDDPKWRGRLCMRDATEAYTQSLIAALIQLHGYAGAKQIVQGWIDNDVDIMSNDVLLIEAVDAGTCDVALVNHYYFANELEDHPSLNAKLYWASQKGAGTQMNLSGAGVVATSDAAADAQRLIEWLATDGQDDFVAGNNEYPANPDVAPDDVLASFGKFKEMPINAEEYGKRNPEALKLMAEVGYE